jgi:predicted RNase H-like nuclease (RuvC/YqgF family)
MERHELIEALRVHIKGYDKLIEENQDEMIKLQGRIDQLKKTNTKHLKSQRDLLDKLRRITGDGRI